jgi:hypothetical protein
MSVKEVVGVAIVLGLVGCTCRDYGYTYRFRGRIVGGGIGSSSPLSIRIRANPPRDEPTTALATDNEGHFDAEAYTGIMWGSCSPFSTRPPVAPQAHEILVLVDADPAGWRVVPAETVRQDCDWRGCVLDLGSIRVGPIRAEQGNPAARQGGG